MISWIDGFLVGTSSCIGGRRRERGKGGGIAATHEANDSALRLIREPPCARWRDYDTEATVRFYGLRLHEANMIRSTPQKIIAQSTDWRFINELKKELRG